jgi:sugar phosphate isomerase/epimerase
MPLAGLSGEWVLWTGTVGFDRPLDERVTAATASGYGAVSTSPREADAWQREGASLRDAADRARDQGAPIMVLDAVFSWLTPVEPRPALAGVNDITVDDSLRIVEAMGIGSINAIALRGSGLPDEAIAEQFARFCDRAADVGCRVHLEFAARSGIPDVATAWDIVRRADRPNGGLLFDSWHFFRGRADLEALAAVPGDRIFAVQLSDGTAEPVGHWYDETMHHRLLPGDGAFDLVGAVRVLAATGALTLIGPEVISDELHARSAHEAAALAAERLEALWGQAELGH